MGTRNTTSNQLLKTALAVIGALLVFDPHVIAANVASPQQPSLKPTPLSPKIVVPEPEPTLTPHEWASTVQALRARKLGLPVEGIRPAIMKGSFYEKRGNAMHRAVDILAPRNTPVLAVDDGRIGRLFSSQAGGITIYQFDKSGKYVYYYAHLERYADNLADGTPVSKGQVIGYVGTSGNAPKNTPHLHFSIYKAGIEGRWWRGAPVDPFEIYDSQSRVPSSREQPVERVSPRIWI